MDTTTLHGRAELPDRPTSDILPAAHVVKYADRLATIGLDPETYAATYSQVIRIVPDDFLGWHGPTVPRSARRAGAPAASIAEPRRDGVFATIGEPVSDRGPTRRPRPFVEPARRVPWLREWLGEPLVRGFRGLRGGLRTAPLPRGSL